MRQARRRTVGVTGAIGDVALGVGPAELAAEGVAGSLRDRARGGNAANFPAAGVLDAAGEVAGITFQEDTAGDSAGDSAGGLHTRMFAFR